MDNSEAAETGADREQWVWLDADGNPVPGDHAEIEPEDDWVYVDSDGNLVNDAGQDDEEWVYLDENGNLVEPQNDEFKAPKLSKKVSRPLPKRESAPLKIPAHAKAVDNTKRSAHHKAPAAAGESKPLVLWPVFLVTALAVAIGGGWYVYTETMVRPELSNNALPVVDSKDPELPGIGMEDPVPVALAPKEEQIEAPVVEAPKNVVHPKAVKVYKDVKTIPPQGLMAHYSVFAHIEDSDPNRPPDSQVRVASWGNSVESSSNQNCLVSDAGEDRLTPKLTIFEGADFEGRPLDKRIVELVRNSHLSSEPNPYSAGKSTWETSIVLVARTGSVGSLVRLKMSEPEHSGISIYNYGNRMSVTVDNGEEQTSAAINHDDREWKLIYLSWDGEAGRMDFSSMALSGKAVQNVSADVPGFEFNLHHIEIGPDISAQFTDVLIYDRPLDEADVKQIRRAFPARFFDDSKD